MANRIYIAKLYLRSRKNDKELKKYAPFLVTPTYRLDNKKKS